MDLFWPIKISFLIIPFLFWVKDYVVQIAPANKTVFVNFG